MKFTVDFNATAKEHRKADADMGTIWTCSCAACRCVKEAAPELLARLKQMASSFHNNWKHGGYLKDCDSAVCLENLEVLHKAEGGR